MKKKMLKEIHISSHEESATFQFDTELSDKEVLDVIVKIYAECEDDFYGGHDIFHVFRVAWRWDKLKQYGIHPAPTENIPQIALWGWNYLKDKMWKNESDENDIYLMSRIRELLGDKIDEATKKHEDAFNKSIEDGKKYYVKGNECTKEEALAAGIYTIKEGNALECQMKGDKRHGKHVRTSSDGELIEIGQYVDDERDGIWIYYGEEQTTAHTYRDGKIRKTEYEYKEEEFRSLQLNRITESRINDKHIISNIRYNACPGGRSAGV